MCNEIRATLVACILRIFLHVLTVLFMQDRPLILKKDFMLIIT